MRFAPLGVADRVKLLAFVTVKDAEEATLLPSTVTVRGPLAAPVGIVNTIVVGVKPATGADSVPPPWLFNVTSGLPPPDGAKPVPVMVTGVPTDPAPGLKLRMDRPDSTIVAVVVAAELPPRPSVTVKLTVKVPAEVYV